MVNKKRLFRLYLKLVLMALIFGFVAVSLDSSTTFKEQFTLKAMLYLLILPLPISWIYEWMISVIEERREQ